MNNKFLAILSPLCICLFVGNAWAVFEPFSFGASETVEHQSNLGHAPTNERADWVSTTELSAAINEPVGRDKFVASGALDLNRYKHAHNLNSTGYSAAAEFDWNTIGDLAGSIGADSHRRQYFYGDTPEYTFGVPPTTELVRNLQTDNHAFVRASLGGQARWTIFGGADANRRNFSSDFYRVEEQRQWSTNLGTRYATSPDLSFGVTGNYVRGDYPHGGANDTVQNFNSKSASLTSRWQVSGNTLVDASLGYTAYYSDAFGGTRHFANGALNFSWTPPSHLSFKLLLKRSADADTSSVGIPVGPQGGSSLNGTSINSVGQLQATYAFTAKTSLEATATYAEHKYENVLTVDNTGALRNVDGATRTSRYFLTAHFMPTRTTDLSCSAGRETLRADAVLQKAAPGYNDNTVKCTASIRFD